MPTMRDVALTGAAIALLTASSPARTAPAGSLIPLDAIASVIQAFDTSDVVALPEAHGSLESHAFRLALIRDSRFLARADDVVVELGNSRYQDLADRYASGGQVAPDQLRRIWEDTTVSTAGNNYAMMAELLAAVRTINRTRKDGRTLRVILGDPPIDWSRVQSRSDHQRHLRLRDSHPAALVITQVVAKGRKALLNYGELHFQRRNIQSNYDMTSSLAQTVVSLVESAVGARVFVIWEVDSETAPEVRTWTSPRIARTAGSAFGARDFSELVGPDLASQRFSVSGSGTKPVPVNAFLAVATEEQVDAVLYLGIRSPTTASFQIPSHLCRRPGFLTEQLRRIRLSAPPFEADQLRDHCAKAGSR